MDEDLDQFVEEIADYLSDDVSVNLTGAHQSGRSYLTRKIALALRERGRTIVTVAGVAALYDRPLAALGLAGLSGPAGYPAGAIAGAGAALAAQLSGHRCAIIIDDADDLDPVSLGVIVAAHRQGLHPVLAVTRNGTPVSEFQPCMRISVGVLSFDGVNRLVHALLPGPVDAAVITQIALLSGGLPGLARALADTGQRTGTIADAAGVWKLRANLWDDRLAGIVEPLVAHLEPAERANLAVLASAGTIDVSHAEELVDASGLARLDAGGMLRVASIPDGRVVAVFPPLLAEYLRRGATLGAAPPAPARDGNGGTIAIGVEAAMLGRRIAEYWQDRLDTRWATWAADPVPANAVPLFETLDAAAAPAEKFAAVIAGTDHGWARPEHMMRFTAWHAVSLALGMGQLEPALDVLAETQPTPELAHQISAVRAFILLHTGTLPDADTLIPVVPPAGAELPHSAWVGDEAMAVTRILTLLAAGRTADALGELSQVSPAFPADVENHRIAAGLAHVLHGDLDEGIGWALRGMAEAEAALQLGEIQAHAYVAVLGLSLAGRLADMDLLLERALTLGTTTLLRQHFQIGLLGLASVAAAWRGDLDYSWSMALQARSISYFSGPFPGMLRDDLDASGMWPVPDTEEERRTAAAAQAWQLARRQVDDGFIASAILSAVSAVDIVPDREQAIAIAERTAHVQSPLLAALSRYVLAAGTGDADALATCIDTLDSFGARIFALEARIARALALRETGRLEESVKQSADAWQATSGLGSLPRGLFLRLGEAVGLSPREREIALMAASGMGAHAIAASLQLSGRTVENVLSGVYRKLGVKGREGLEQAVSTWALFSDT